MVPEEIFEVKESIVIGVASGFPAIDMVADVGIITVNAMFDCPLISSFALLRFDETRERSPEEETRLEGVTVTVPLFEPGEIVPKARSPTSVIEIGSTMVAEATAEAVLAACTSLAVKA